MIIHAILRTMVHEGFIFYVDDLLVAPVTFTTQRRLGQLSKNCIKCNNLNLAQMILQSPVSGVFQSDFTNDEWEADRKAVLYNRDLVSCSSCVVGKPGMPTDLGK